MGQWGSARQEEQTGVSSFLYCCIAVLPHCLIAPLPHCPIASLIKRLEDV